MWMAGLPVGSLYCRSFAFSAAATALSSCGFLSRCPRRERPLSMSRIGRTRARNRRSGPNCVTNLLHRGRRRRSPAERGATWWLVLIVLVFLCLFFCPVFIRSTSQFATRLPVRAHRERRRDHHVVVASGTLPHLGWPPRATSL